MKTISIKNSIKKELMYELKNEIKKELMYELRNGIKKEINNDLDLSEKSNIHVCRTRRRRYNKINDYKKKEIRKDYIEGMKLFDIMKKYNISKPTIYKYVDKKNLNKSVELY